MRGNKVTTITTASKTTQTCATITECNAKDQHTTSVTTSTDGCPTEAAVRNLKRQAKKACGNAAMVYPRDPLDPEPLRIALQKYKDSSATMDFVPLEAPAAGFTACYWVEALSSRRRNELINQGLVR